MANTPRPSSTTGRATAVLGALALVVAVVLGTTGPASAQTAAPGAEGDALVRAAHLVPDVGEAEVTLSPFSAEAGDDPLVLAPEARYGDVGGYQEVAPGFYTVSVAMADDVDAAPVVTGTLEALPGRAYTTAVLSGGDAPRVSTLEDDLTPPAGGSARVRLVAAAPSAPTTTVRAQDGPVVAQDAAFGAATGYAEVPAGPWTLRADGGDLTGTTQVDLAAGSVSTLLVLEGDGGGLRLAAVPDAAPEASGDVAAADGGAAEEGASTGGMAAVPSGGADTGAGGTAGAAPLGVLGAGAALVLAGGALLVARLRPAAARR